jgi:DNA-binding NarL/FixJ family response regulator
MSRVLIADDHAVVRAGYKQFLEAEPSITEVGEAPAALKRSIYCDVRSGTSY